MDADLLNTLYQNYHRELFLYLYALCKNRELAEDLTQETFLKALLSLPKGHANIRAWLYLVGRNLYFNYWKKEQHTVFTPDFPETSSASEDSPVDALIADERRRASCRSISSSTRCFSERRRALFTALNSLAQNKREVLLLQYFSGLSQKEIAAVLHLTPENVRVLSYRAKKELKNCLEVHDYDLS